MRKSSTFVIIILILLLSCQNKKQSENVNTDPLEIPPSYLSFRINFPVQELESGLNRILPGTILNGKIPLKDGKDTLILHIKRKGKLDMAIRKNEVFASIPLEVEAAIKKKVLGVTFSNEDAPIEFSGSLKASAKVQLEDDWNLSTTCEYKGFDLGQNPEFSVMGLTFNIDGLIEKTLENHRDELSNIICGALGEALDFRRIVNKVWLDIQKPVRIARNPTKFWLYSTPSALNGQLIPVARDTLAVHVEYRTAIEISPTYKSIEEKIPLTRKGNPLNTNSQLVAYPKLVLPFIDLAAAMKQELVSQSFTYEGYTIVIEDVEVGRKGNLLRIDILTSGDLNGVVIATGLPGINEDRELFMDEFKYEIESKEDWVKMTDWAIHQFAEDYVKDKVRLDIQPFFKNLDQMIMDGIGKSKLGPKLAVDIAFSDISSNQIRMTDSALEWLFNVEGKASLTLKEGLFKKKNP